MFDMTGSGWAPCLTAPHTKIGIVRLKEALQFGPLTDRFSHSETRIVRPK